MSSAPRRASGPETCERAEFESIGALQKLNISHLAQSLRTWLPDTAPSLVDARSQKVHNLPLASACADGL